MSISYDTTPCPLHQSDTMYLPTINLLHDEFTNDKFVVEQRNTTALVYKNIICFFSFPYNVRDVRMGRVRERDDNS